MEKKYRLSQDVKCAGCAAKLNQKALSNILEGRNFYRAPETVVGLEHYDDAGVYRISANELIVQTTDFFPPIVDDPFDFGRIATANALSDIFVMGAKPLTALNICCFPYDQYPDDIYIKIIEGSADILEKARCTLLGGHTIESPELIFGIAATGICKERELLKNSAAKPGDILFLSKPIGTGLVTTALKADMCNAELEKEAIQSMTELNTIIPEAKKIINAATDITGFGLAGHLLEICRASKANARLILDDIPVFSGVYELLSLGMLPAGSYKNKENSLEFIDLKNDPDSDIIFDAQTSGGILSSVSPENADTFSSITGNLRIGEIIEEKKDGKIIEII